MDKLLTCPICFEWFGNDGSHERAPLMLDCGHTFCRACISTSPRCFSCRLFTVKKRPNIVLQHIVDYWTRKRHLLAPVIGNDEETPPTPVQSDSETETEYCSDDGGDDGDDDLLRTAKPDDNDNNRQPDWDKLIRIAKTDGNWDQLLRTADDLIFVTVKTPCGEAFQFPIDQSETVENSKERLEVWTGYPPQQQRLIFAGRQLTDDKTWSEYPIGQGCTVHMILARRGD